MAPHQVRLQHDRGRPCQDGDLDGNGPGEQVHRLLRECLLTIVEDVLPASLSK